MCERFFLVLSHMGFPDKIKTFLCYRNVSWQIINSCQYFICILTLQRNLAYSKKLPCIGTSIVFPDGPSLDCGDKQNRPHGHSLTACFSL